MLGIGIGELIIIGLIFAPVLVGGVVFLYLLLKRQNKK